jgi:hypothetical protein
MEIIAKILDSFNNKQNKEIHHMEKRFFTDKETTKEQYLKFKEYIKENCHGHSAYIAYYIFKHRLKGEERDAYLEDEVRKRCWKGLYSGRITSYGGGDMTESYGIPMFKNWVIGKYNEFAEYEE